MAAKKDEPIVLPTVSNAYENSHEVLKGDKRHDGPYLDDIRAEQEEAYRKARHDAINAAAKKSAKQEKEAAKQEEEVHPSKESADFLNKEGTDFVDFDPSEEE